MTNFNRPYFSKSISEFWKRWHISLSTWFRDYLYISLGGNRVSIPRWYFNLLIVFLVSGLWHGANWTYIFWGGLNGIYLIFAIVSQKLRNRINRAIGLDRYSTLNHLLQVIITFILVCFAWIFFRANNVDDAFLIIKKIFEFSGPIYSGTPSETIYCLLGIFILFIVEFREEFYRKSFLHNKNWQVRYFSYIFLIILILLIGVFDGRQFIYFQF